MGKSMWCSGRVCVCVCAWERRGYPESLLTAVIVPDFPAFLNCRCECVVGCGDCALSVLRRAQVRNAQRAEV